MKNNSHNSYPKLSTNGLSVPLDFPIFQYESVHKIIGSTKANHPLYEHYSGAWNALAYRFRAAIDYGDIFVESLRTYGDAPPSEERYIQERTLFNFFGSGFSVFESAFYGLYTIGAFLEPKYFSLSSKEDQRSISPKSTNDAFVRAFPTDSILTTFQEVISDAEYQRWRDIRNVLIHRTAPGRRIYASMGGKDTIPAVWKLNDIPLDESISKRGREELSRLLTHLLDASMAFVNKYFMKN